MGSFSYFLFARPSFSEGMGRALDLGNTLSGYNISPTPQDADVNALLADWCAIGEDMRTVMGAGREQANQTRKGAPARAVRS